MGEETVYLLRCTARLRRDVARHLPAAIGDETPDTRLGDWFADRLNAGRGRYVVVTNATTLLTVVVPARDLARLPARITDAVARLLASIGVAPAAIRRELRRMDAVRVAPTNDRVVLGSMRALMLQARTEIGELPHRPGRTLDHVNAWLAHVPCGPLGLGAPADAARRQLGARRVPRSLRHPATQR